MASLDVEKVDKVYPGGQRALAEMTLAIGDGELIVLVGPSGCGKSTLLRVIAGLEEATAGLVKIGGRAVNGLSPQERNVAMVFQDYALYPHLTARKNLEFPLQMRRMARAEIERRVAAIARALEIEPWLERLPKQLSGGQRQRVAMGRALVREPAVSLLDEPLSNLDARLRVQVRAEIKELQRRIRTTMVYVTHDQVEAMTLGDRVAVLDRGRLQQVSPPAELYAAPRNTFVAGFIGNPPMNLLAARLESAGAGLSLDVQGAKVTLAPPRADADALRGLIGERVTAGARPEAIRLVDGGGVAATVEHVENLGHETLLHLTLAGGGASSGKAEPERLVVRVDGMLDLEGGAPVALALDPARVHLFDQNGVALTHV